MLFSKLPFFAQTIPGIQRQPRCDPQSLRTSACPLFPGTGVAQFHIHIKRHELATVFFFSELRPAHVPTTSRLRPRPFRRRPARLLRLHRRGHQRRQQRNASFLPSLTLPSSANPAALSHLLLFPLCISSIAFILGQREADEIIFLLTHSGFSRCLFQNFMSSTDQCFHLHTTLFSEHVRPVGFFSLVLTDSKNRLFSTLFIRNPIDALKQRLTLSYLNRPFFSL